ncbi:MAG: flagellar FliL protein [Gammaproteobacteria bacterium]|jgi:flagellar FliL protein
MADEEVVEEGSGDGKKKLILITAGVLVLVGGTVAGTLMFVGGGDSDSVGVSEEVVIEKGDPVYVDLKPPFTVNLDPEDSVGFLQISIQILTHSDDVADDLEKHRPLIRNNLVTLFSQQKSLDLRAPEGKEQLQKSALELVQSIVDEHGSGGAVGNIFFTSFVMQ